MVDDQQLLSSIFPATTHAPEETRDLGASCAPLLRAGAVVALVGSLGAGKTQFVQGLARGFGINPGVVSSPTFSIVHEYAGERRLVHMDLYRIEFEAELAEFGFEEYLTAETTVVIEWPQIARDLFPDDTITLSFTHSGEETRLIELLSPSGAS
jgi:tRNA threonylcarbamoyladenosine biosynthesis protein TsaE